MKIYSLLFIIMICFACESPKTITVENYGVLRKIKHEGDISGKVKIDTLDNVNLYGLGALAQMKGEITVVNGQIYVSKVVDSVAVIGSSENVNAALFVFSQIDKWDTLTIEGDDDLELLVSSTLKERGALTPTPFIVIGEPELVNYHIINLDPMSEDKSDHKAGSFTDTVENRAVTLLGFYADDAQGVYTHHDSKIHVHYVDGSSLLNGHVDEVKLGNNEFKLLIPKP